MNGLAVYGPNMGTILEIEVSAVPAPKEQGRINITGVVDEEEMGAVPAHFGGKVWLKARLKMC